MFNVGMSGMYKLIVHKGDESKPTQVVDWFPNLITDAGLNALGTMNNGIIYQYCRVGSGSTTPLVTDVGLVAPVGVAVPDNNSLSSTGITTTAPYYSWKRMGFKFNPGQATGNISEISVGWSSSTNTAAFSRTLITEEGTPITITVLPDDYLTVYYELRLYPNMTDVVSTLDIGGTSYEVIARPAKVGLTDWNGFWIGYVVMGTLTGAYAYDGTISNAFGSPLYTQQSSISRINETYSAYATGDFYRDVSFTIPVDNCNFTAGIRSLLLYYGNNASIYQYQFTPAIPKTINNTLRLTFRVSWGRYTP